LVTVKSSSFEAKVEQAVSDPMPTVLVVDAEPATHELVFAALADECTVMGARSRALGLTIAARRPPDVLILSDALADLGGFVTELRALHRNARFVFLVAPGRPHAEVSVLAPLGAIVARPVDVERLCGAVRSAVRLGAMSAGVQRMRTGSFSPKRQR
jgi:DNA-binding response OmpR family regulator